MFDDGTNPRVKFGVLAPATNTTVQLEFERMRPVGVVNHHCRIDNEDIAVNSDLDFERANASIANGTEAALGVVMKCRPDHVILGMSSETFWNGLAASVDLQKRLSELCGVGVTLGSDACRAALGAFDSRRIAVITPYMPVGDHQVLRFFSDCGYDVRRLLGLKKRSPYLIGETTQSELRAALQQVDGDDVDAIVQVGTNLAMTGLAASAELWLEKPVIAINAAIYWYALRTVGILDRVDGHGALLRYH
jgi:maleate isomerase